MLLIAVGLHVESLVVADLMMEHIYRTLNGQMILVREREGGQVADRLLLVTVDSKLADTR